MYCKDKYLKLRKQASTVSTSTLFKHLFHHKISNSTESHHFTSTILKQPSNEFLLSKNYAESERKQRQQK
ncbi:CLUMA_CG002053, isoform A [Clunio marinus]|uniref:CLUMA_CG002053, isoform A n=1 Tax=Clunio marinus TaxID=568069 RepID=A0A1J1HPY4_9DIPT|nr:CLUMA_CG002053, isoform A [Clunio marinus]